MPDDELKKAYRYIKDTESDDVLIDTFKDIYHEEIKDLKELPEELIENLKSKKRDRTPTLAVEQIEDNLKNTKPNAVNSVMRPEVESVEKDSKFFSNLKYHVSIDKVEIRKKLSDNETFSLVGDVFDKTVGVNYKKRIDRFNWKTGLEFDPTDGAAKVYTNYNMPNTSYSGSIYLEKNPGISAGFEQRINRKTKISANLSCFKSDSALKIEYKSEPNKKDTITAGLYASTMYKEIGLMFRLTSF